MAGITDDEIEQEILDKGLTAPRVIKDDIQNSIVSEFYFTAADGILGESEMGTRPAGIADALKRLTFCVFVLRNGFTVTGQSACVSPDNFDAALGKKIAYKDAVDKIWVLEGYLLQEKLSKS